MSDSKDVMDKLYDMMREGLSKRVYDIINNSPNIDWNLLATYAIKFGYFDLYNQLVDEKKITDWTSRMKVAASTGNLEYVLNNQDKPYYVDLELLYEAGKGGNRDIIEYFLNKSPRHNDNMFKAIITGAEEGNHTEIIDHYKNYKYAPIHRFFNDPMTDRHIFSTIRREYLRNDDIKGGINYDAYNYYLSINDPMRAIEWAMKHHLEYPVINILNSPNYEPLIDWNVLAGYCIKYDYPRIYKKILNDHRITDWTCIMAQSARLRILNFLHEYRKRRYDPIIVLMYAGESGDQKIVNIFLRKINPKNLSEEVSQEVYGMLILGAARGGHANIINNYKNRTNYYYIKLAAEEAIAHGYKKLGKKLSDFNDHFYANLLGRANNLEDPELKNAYNNLHTKDSVLEGIGYTGDYDTIDSIVFTLNNEDLESLLIGHLRSGNSYLAHYFWQKGLTSKTIMNLAVDYGNTKLVEYIMEAFTNDTDWNKFLIKSTNPDVADIFIQKGATNIDKGLISAIKQRNNDMIYYYIEKGADTTKALNYAIDNDLNSIEILLDTDAKYNIDDIMETYIKEGHEKYIEYFIERGANVENALRVALMYEKLDALLRLIEYDINIPKTIRYIKKHFHPRYAYRELIKLLLKKERERKEQTKDQRSQLETKKELYSLQDLANAFQNRDIKKVKKILNNLRPRNSDLQPLVNSYRKYDSYKEVSDVIRAYMYKNHDDSKEEYAGNDTDQDDTDHDSGHDSDYDVGEGSEYDYEFIGDDDDGYYSSD